MIQYDCDGCYDIEVGTVKGKFNEDDILEFIRQLKEHEVFVVPEDDCDCDCSDDYRSGYINGYDDGDADRAYLPSEC